MRKPPQPPRSKAARRGGASTPDAPPDAATTRGRALKLLSRREHSAAELKAKLQRRGADDDTAGEAVQAMAAAGWQSDERYAEMLLRNRIEQYYGPLRIRMELAQAGVSEAEIRAAFEAADCDWRARCAELAARRFRSKAKGAAEWQKQYRFLASRGVTSEQIRFALKSAPDDVFTGDDEIGSDF